MNSRRCLVALVATFALIALSAAPAGAAPTASFDVSANPTSGVPVTFTSTSTAPLLFAISKVEWDFDGDGTYEVSGTEPTATHTFASGTYQVGIRVTSSEPELTGNTATRLQAGDRGHAPAARRLLVRAEQPRDRRPDPVRLELDRPGRRQPRPQLGLRRRQRPVTERNPTHAYTTPGQKTVRLTVNDGKGGVDDVTQTIVVRDPRAPTASFKTAPGTPRAGDKVTFTSTSAPVEGQEIDSQEWDLDSDGDFDDGKGATVSKTFDSQGVYRVALKVTQENGNFAVAEGTVRVGALVVTTPPAGGGQNPGPKTPNKPTGAKWTLLSPFPVVNISGRAYLHRTQITKLTVIAPRGSITSVTCVGKKACPNATRRKRARPKHLRLRFKTFERYLAGRGEAGRRGAQVRAHRQVRPLQAAQGRGAASSRHVHQPGQAQAAPVSVDLTGRICTRRANR